MLMLRLDWKQLRASEIDLRKLTTRPADLQVVAPEPLPAQFVVGALEPTRAAEVVSKLIETQSAERISEPKVITLEGQPANVQVGNELPHISTIIEETVNGRHKRRVETRQTGQSIQLTPKLLDGGQVAIAIDAESSQLIPDANSLPSCSVCRPPLRTVRR
jgi:type II secretory pathway component GspD/PulD (secretin)